MVVFLSDVFMSNDGGNFFYKAFSKPDWKDRGRALSGTAGLPAITSRIETAALRLVYCCQIMSPDSSSAVTPHSWMGRTRHTTWLSSPSFYKSCFPPQNRNFFPPAAHFFTRCSSLGSRALTKPFQTLSSPGTFQTDVAERQQCFGSLVWKWELESIKCFGRVTIRSWSAFIISLICIINILQL